jgi:hypothetical protein
MVTSRVVPCERNETMAGTSKIRSNVLLSCRVSPLTVHDTSNVDELSKLR